MARTLVGFILIIFIFSGSALAETLAGWSHLSPVNNSTEKSGVLLNGNAVNYSSPRSANLDGDPTNGLETVVATSDAVVNAVSADGKLLWSTQLPNHTCTEASAENKLFSSAAVGNIYGDGNIHVVVGYGGIGGIPCGGGVLALDGRTGQQLWHFDLKKFAKERNFGAPIGHTVFSSPVLKDINRDGKMEIAFGSYDRNIYVLNTYGEAVWYYQAADTVWSSGSFADIDGDGRDELIIGTDISENKFLTPATENGGYVYAFKVRIKKEKARKRQGSRRLFSKNLKFFNFQNPKAYFWRTHFPQTIHSTPSIGELIPENPGLEIAVGTGCYFPENNDIKEGRWIKIISLKTGAVLRTLDTPACMTSSPAIADIDEDGLNDVVAYASGSKSIGADGKSKVMAWNPRTSTLLWETNPLAQSFNDIWGGHFSSPIIADLDGTGSLEVVVGNINDLVILAGKTGEHLTCKAANCGDTSRLSTGGLIRGTPEAIDLNADGKLDLVIASRRKYSSAIYGALFAWTNLEEIIDSADGIHPPYSTPWSMYKNTVQGNGI